ncbi:spore germination protein [Neobacillus mesonae]|uniref:Spore germination protein n=1 Tax=Neobacillus mesonae TaxID=1193713 RepID=A0A3T0HY84_9BACI|nr:spore germination protein [Neobacillus mesonae]AZU62075.1 hypothetical protein CHR53_12725 [Neobacillus mesonae]
MARTPFGVNIGTISGGIVNFDGAVAIAPIEVSKSVSGSGGGNSGLIIVTTNGTSTTIKKP